MCGIIIMYMQVGMESLEYIWANHSKNGLKAKLGLLIGFWNIMNKDFVLPPP